MGLVPAPTISRSTWSMVYAFRLSYSGDVHHNYDTKLDIYTTHDNIDSYACYPHSQLRCHRWFPYLPWTRSDTTSVTGTYPSSLIGLSQNIGSPAG